jgi:hypothetical protein
MEGYYQDEFWGDESWRWELFKIVFDDEIWVLSIIESSGPASRVLVSYPR